MKTVIISPSNLTGEIRIPSSKSIGHRAIICAALSNGTTLLDNIGTSQDIEATLEGIQSLGARIKRISDSMVHIKGIDKDKITRINFLLIMFVNVLIIIILYSLML